MILPSGQTTITYDIDNDIIREDYARKRISESPLLPLRNHSPLEFNSIKILKEVLFDDLIPGKEKLMSMTPDSYRVLRNGLLNVILYVQLENSQTDLNEICTCLEHEISNIRALGQGYLHELTLEHSIKHMAEGAKEQLGQLETHATNKT